MLTFGPGYSWWRLLWHWLRGHELTHGGPSYPSPVCRECEWDKLHESSVKK